MEEKHQFEQYFFDAETLAHLVEFLKAFERPCCICAPLLGQALVEADVRVKILDIDQRFAHLPGFETFDLQQPRWLGEEFDIIVCDPPFFNVSLTQMFSALRLLSRHLYTQPLLVGYLTRRATAITNTFARFNLEPAGYFPKYATVQKVDRNEIEFFSNLPEEDLERLRIC